MDYNEFTYLWPPRPGSKRAVAGDMLAVYSQKGWIAQLKKNGTCTPVFACGDRVIFKTRHPELNNADHKQWKPSAAHILPFQGREKWNVYVGELLNNKVTGGTKDTLYLFDKIVHEGKTLVGVTFAERYKLLEQFPFNDKVVLAQNFVGITKHHMKFLGIDDEGFVMKDPNAPLETCRENSNQKWQVKCRKPTKNYTN